MPQLLIRSLIMLTATCGAAAAQDLGTMNPKPLPPLEKPDDPKTPAKELFGRKTAPVKLEARSIGYYTHGCPAGGVALPINGPTWQVMRLSRNRNWGHPQLIKTLEHLAKKAPSIGWPGFLVGDMAQPRGGPMITGHWSHQVGLDADVWLTPMPDRELTRQEREEMLATNVVNDKWTDVRPDVWSQKYIALYKMLAQEPVPAGLRRLVGQPFQELHQVGMAPVAVARQPHHLPGRAVDRQRHGAGETTLGVEADGARFHLRRRGFAAEQFLRRGSGIIGMRERRQRLGIDAAPILGGGALRHPQESGAQQWRGAARGVAPRCAKRRVHRRRHARGIRIEMRPPPPGRRTAESAAKPRLPAG